VIDLILKNTSTPGEMTCALKAPFQLRGLYRQLVQE